MLGLGVAFAAVPLLSFFMPDLVHQVQLLSLLLNGVTALFAVFGFAQGGFMDWRRAILLSVVTTLTAPVGAWVVGFVPQIYVWYIYFASVAFLAYRLFRPVQPRAAGTENLVLAMILAVPISVLSGFLGVGPGFLLLPTLILVGFDPKKAVAMNAFAVTPPSFSSLLPHLATAQWDFPTAIPPLLAGAIRSFLGAKASAMWMPSARLKQLFGVLIVVMTGYRIWQMLG